MDHRNFLRWRTPRNSPHHLLVKLLGCVAIAIFALFILIGALAVGDTSTRPTLINEFIKVGLPVHEAGVNVDKKQLVQEEARRRKLLAEEGGNSLRLKMIHRNALESPARRDYDSTEEEILEILAFDETRMRGFHASISSRRDRMDLDALSARQTTSSCRTRPPPEQKQNQKQQQQQRASPPLSPPAPHAAPPTSPPPHAAPPISPPPEQLSIQEFQSTMISGASLGNIGQYFVEFYIGTPGQRFLFIADTGSDLVWVPCTPCTTCGPDFAGPVFSPKNSSSFAPISCSDPECNLVPGPPIGPNCTKLSPTPSCTYDYVYGDLSESSGIFAYDTVSMLSNVGRKVEIKTVAFGCGTENTGPSFTKVGGVIGLGQGLISFTSQVGYMYGSKFSYCFESFFHLRVSSTLVFGDSLVGTTLRDPVKHTPFLKNPLSETFYYVAIEKVEIGGKALAIAPSVWDIDPRNGNGGVVIDSGTTLTYFMQPAYALILAAFQKAIPYPRAPSTASLNLCYNISGIAKPRFPKFSITFQGNAVFRPAPQNYFLHPTEDIRCLGFLANSSPSGMSILGNLLQQDFYVEYDRLNNRLGFARADCSAQS